MYLHSPKQVEHPTTTTTPTPADADADDNEHPRRTVIHISQLELRVVVLFLFFYSFWAEETVTCWATAPELRAVCQAQEGVRWGRRDQRPWLLQLLDLQPVMTNTYTVYVSVMFNKRGINTEVNPKQNLNKVLFYDAVVVICFGFVCCFLYL